MADDKKKRYINGDGIAESPLEKYPGKVTFPVPPSGRTYLEFKAAVKRREDEDENDFLKLQPHWRGAVAIATVEVEDVDSLAFEDAPLDVIRWVCDCTDEYLRRFFLQEL